jgi:hypothetical protein
MSFECCKGKGKQNFYDQKAIFFYVFKHFSFPVTSAQWHVRTVAERCIPRLLALAQRRCFCFVSRKLNWSDRCSLMRTIAKRLVLRLTTGTPEIVLTCFEFDHFGFFCCDDGCICHERVLSNFHIDLAATLAQSIIEA